MEFSFEKKGCGNGDQLLVEEYLDFTNGGVEEVLEIGYGGDEVVEMEEEVNTSGDTSTVSTAVGSCNSISGADARSCLAAGPGLSGELFEPQLDDLAELEWQIMVEEESFSNEDLQKLKIISPSGIKSSTLSTITNSVIKTETISTAITTEPATIPSPSSSFSNSQAAVAKSYSYALAPTRKAARSKRFRSRSSGPSSWSSAPILRPDPVGPTEVNSSNPILVKKPAKLPKKKDTPVFALAPPSSGRRCLHCNTDKTPQWRTGPMGPKTLCNACGVRYKSGRLVPEYRPAASPTFVVSKHSNSHRKVLELRRQKEMHMHQLHHHQQLMHGLSPVHAQNGDDYLIHHPIGARFSATYLDGYQ